MPNTREWALIFLDLRGSGVDPDAPRSTLKLKGVIRAALAWKLLVTALGMVAWVSLEVWAGARFSLWMPDLATDTVLWFVTAGLVLFSSVTNVGSEQHFFRTKALATMRVTAVVQGYVSWLRFL